MSSRSRLSDPEFAHLVAALYVDGFTHKQIADEVGAARETVGIWVKDPRVQAHAARLSKERTLRVTRKLDTEIESRIENASEMDTELLLKIRREFLERSLKVDLGAGKDNPDTIKDTVEAIESDPDLAEALRVLVGGDSAKIAS